MKLSLVIPCYNEARNIPLLLERFAGVITRADIELLLVDNGSTDGSGELFDRLLPAYPFARKVRVEVNQGYGYGILAGLKEASGDYVGWTHADMQTDPFDAIRALEEIERRGCPAGIFVKGRRWGRPLADRFFTVGMGVFESLYLGKALWDINAQPNIFHRTFFESWDRPPHDFSLDLYAYYLAMEQGLEIVRIEVVFPERLHGHSSWNTGLAAKWKFIRRTLDFSVKLKKGLGK